MTAKDLKGETLRAMIEAGVVREVLISRQDDKWGLAIRLGGAGSRLLPVRSRREALRTWASLTALGRFAESAGIRAFRSKFEIGSHIFERLVKGALHLRFELRR